MSAAAFVLTASLAVHPPAARAARPLPRTATAPPRSTSSNQLSPGQANAPSAAPLGLHGATNLDTDIAEASAGSVIHLSSGSYREVQDEAPRSGWVTVSGAGDPTPPTIAGAALWGAQFVRFVDVKFSTSVIIDHSPVFGYSQVAKDVAVVDSTVDCGSHTTTPFTEGVGIRGASRDITLRNDLITDCVVGFGSVAQDRFSRDVTINHCTFTNLPGDAIELGAFNGLVISRNVISDIADPSAVFHNDGIQFFGNDRDVTIADNVLANSRNQLILIQDAVKGTFDHTSVNKNITIVGNLIYGAGAVAVQDQGGVDVRFVQNTLWHNHFGSLWVVQSDVSGRRPQHTAVVGNIIQGLLLYQARLSLEEHNLIVGAQSHYVLGSGDLQTSPAFVSIADGDFRLQRGSPASVAGSRKADQRALGNAIALLPRPTRGGVALGALQPGSRAMTAGAPRFASAFESP